MASATPYGQLGLHLASGRIDWVADTIKLLLADSSYTPDKDAHATRADIFGELSTPGYGPATIGSATRTYDAATDTTVLDGADVAIGPFTGMPRWGVLYKAHGAAAAADELIGWIDFVTAQDVVNGTLTITWHATGIVRIEALT